MINNDNIEKVKKMIKETNEKPIIVFAQDDNFNRKILEYGKFDIILSIENGVRKNSIRQIDSGLNHVLANIAKKNSIAVGIDLGELNKLNKKELAKKLTKIKQNIKICRKAGVKIAALNYKDSKNTFDLLISLGASSIQAKESISF